MEIGRERGKMAVSMVEMSQCRVEQLPVRCEAAAIVSLLCGPLTPLTEFVSRVHG